MKVGEWIRVYLEVDRLDDEMDAAQKGDEIEIPPIRGLRHGGKKFSLRSSSDPEVNGAVLRCDEE
jgi:hypothetical protein